MTLSIDPIRPYLGLIRVGLIAMVAAALVWRGYAWGASRWHDKYDSEVAAHKTTKDGNKAVLDNLALLTRAAADRAKTASTAVKGERAAADKRYEGAKDEAKRNADALRAALRAGKQRLSDTWACPAPGAAAGRAAGDAGKADAARRYDSAARIVAAADADAAALNWLWDGWMADRKAVIAAGCAVEAKP